MALRNCLFAVALAASIDVFAICGSSQAQEGSQMPGTVQPAAAASGDLLSQGTIDLDTPDFNLRLVRSSQTVAALNPKGAGAFDFTPADRLSGRKADGYMHLGDLTFRVRQGTSGSWTSYSTAAARSPVTALAAGGQVLAAADLAPTLPADCPLGVRRTWELEGGRLVLRLVLTNKTATAVQIGGLGIPMIFNNYITGRNLTQAHEVCSFSDPYVGLEGGYLQVTRLKGSGPALLVVPQGGTAFEAYSPLLNEPTQRGQTFEGFYEWMVHSQAWAEKEWASTQPWNRPTLKVLEPGASVSYGLKFLVSDQIRHIDQTLEANQRPVAIGVPGYILPQGLQARLFLKYRSAVQSMTTEPAGAIQCTRDENDPCRLAGLHRARPDLGQGEAPGRLRGWEPAVDPLCGDQTDGGGRCRPGQIPVL